MYSGWWLIRKVFLLDPKASLSRNGYALLVGVSSSGTMALVAFVATPEYEELFRGFGVRFLSMATWLVFTTYAWWGLVPLAILVTWCLLPEEKRHDTTMLLGTVSTVLMFLLFFWGVTDMPHIAPSVR